MANGRYDKLDFSDSFSSKYKEFTPILNEYFSRMKVDLNLSDEQVNHKVGLLLKNVRSIKFGLLPLLFEGAYAPGRKKILLSANLLNGTQNYEHLFSIITHELDHASSYDKDNKKFGMYRYDSDSKTKFNPHDVLLDELRAELASTRRVFNKHYEDENMMLRKTEGYVTFPTFSTVLQNSLGINEDEFLKASENGRESFDKQMETKFASPEDYYKFMDRFTINTSIILNMRSGETKQTNQNLADYGKAFLDLRELSYIGLNLRMEKDIKDNPNMNLKEYMKNIRYAEAENNYNFNNTELEFGMTDMLEQVRFLLHATSLPKVRDILEHKVDLESLKKPKSKAKELFQSKVMYLEMLDENKESIGNKFTDSVEKIYNVQYTEELKEYSKEELGLEFKDSKETEYFKELDKDVIEKKKEERAHNIIWDNTEISVHLEAYINKGKESKVNMFYAKILKRLQERYIPKLNEATQDQINEDSFRSEMSDIRNTIRAKTKSRAEISNMDNNEHTSENTNKKEEKEYNDGKSDR